MITWFAFSGFWFWAYVTASFFGLGYWTYKDRYFMASLDVSAAIFLLSVTGNLPVLDVWAYVQAKPYAPFVWVTTYLMIGTLWSAVKWRKLILKAKALYKEWDANKSEERAAILPFELSHNYHMVFDPGRKPSIKVSSFKGRITGWMAFWPMSLLMWILGDFLADVFDAMYRMVSGFFQKIADDALND